MDYITTNHCQYKTLRQTNKSPTWTEYLMKEGACLYISSGRPACLKKVHKQTVINATRNRRQKIDGVTSCRQHEQAKIRPKS